MRLRCYHLAKIPKIWIFSLLTAGKVYLFWEGHNILQNLYCTYDKFMVDISQNFVAFSEYMNFTGENIFCNYFFVDRLECATVRSSEGWLTSWDSILSNIFRNFRSIETRTMLTHKFLQQLLMSRKYLIFFYSSTQFVKK